MKGKAEGRTGRGRVWVRWSLPGLALTLGCLALIAALGRLALATDPPAEPGAKTEQTEHSRKAKSSRQKANAVTNKTGAEIPAWEHYVNRLRDVTQRQVRLRAQEDALRGRLAQPGGLAERVRERIAARLHDLDTQDRQVRREKQEVLEEIAKQGDSLRTQLEDAQADLITRQAAQPDEAKRKRLEVRLREVEAVLRNLTAIQKDPDRFIDFIPGRWKDNGQKPGTQPLFPPGPPEGPGGEAGAISNRFVVRRIRQVEEQIRFMRRRLDALEQELNQLKRAVARNEQPGSQESSSETGEKARKQRQEQRVPSAHPPNPAYERRRRPQGPLMAPNRAPIPPAGFAPNAEPGLEPVGPQGQLPPPSAPQPPPGPPQNSP